ncbi:hypothetical protein WUBG_01270 [Wuchereria bancrofti]|uniref:Uncharacterized protein n=1 Tax=Wuchereria bancrofti TaxID=6293 RepID=J9FDY2_WUCBA|nr:hypothetical protein WUBG_01270 [Wuchereria bancrofti]
MAKGRLVLSFRDAQVPITQIYYDSIKPANAFISFISSRLFNIHSLASLNTYGLAKKRLIVVALSLTSSIEVVIIYRYKLFPALSSNLKQFGKSVFHYRKMGFDKFRTVQFC